MLHRVVSAPPERGIDLLAGGNHTDGWHIEMSSRARAGKNESLPAEEKKKNAIFKLVAHEESRRELCVFGLVTTYTRTVLWHPVCLNEGRDEVEMKRETC